MTRLLLERPIGPAFERRTIAVAAGAERPYDDGDWRDAIVLVARGEIELVGVAGASCRFVAGDSLWLTGLPLRVLRNPGREPAVLVAVSRASTDEFSADAESNRHD